MQWHPCSDERRGATSGTVQWEGLRFGREPGCGRGEQSGSVARDSMDLDDTGEGLILKGRRAAGR
jgi:hypothetical protein